MASIVLISVPMFGCYLRSADIIGNSINLVCHGDIDTRYSLRHRKILYCEYNTSGVFSSLGNSESCLLILRWATLSQ
ncbi:hypothetical protein Hanom_Chr06g00566771 [Helianthus anomalus]